MPTDAAPNYDYRHGLSFAARGLAWSLGIFGLVRSSWIETLAILPLTQLQARFAQIGFGPPVGPIEVTLACSGADAVALCLGAIFAYPTNWPTRLRGAAGGLGLILGLNMLRIGTLGRAANSPTWFEALHLYAWPALLMLAVAGYVFAWMCAADGKGVVLAPGAPPAYPRVRSLLAASQTNSLARRFVLLTVMFLVVFIATSPMYLESAGILAMAAVIVRATAGTLRVLGVHVEATANVLLTTRGGFILTQECIATPLIPVYLAAVFAYANTWRRRTLALLAGVPLFIGLSIARLLVVALPASLVGSPIFLVHAFYQLLLAGVVVLIASIWRHGVRATAWHRALLGGVLGSALAYVLGAPYTRALTWAFAATTPLADPQGAIAFLPAFQVGLYVALAVATFIGLTWRSYAAGFALLGLLQVAAFAGLHVLVREAGFAPHVRDVRIWALAAPLLVVVALLTSDRRHPNWRSRPSATAS